MCARQGYGSVTQAIKERLNIVDLVRRYVNLQKAGNRWMAPCPFHQESKASFSVNEEEGFFYCFGCQASGDVFDFYGRVNGLEFRDVLEQLAQEAGVSLEGYRQSPQDKKQQDKRKLFLKLHDAAKSFYRRSLAGPGGKDCRDYLEGRKLAPAVIESFELGWSPAEWNGLVREAERLGISRETGVESGLLVSSDKGSVYDRFRARLMFPIKNLSGQTIAFGGRIIADADAAKYINSSDSPIYKKGDNLYALFQARRHISIKKSIILTEGYMDVLTLHQFGYANSVGVLGTAFTPEQVKRLSGFCSDLELIFDGDAPGRKAALRACEMILARGLSCRVVLLPDGEDIDSLLHGQGAVAFEDLRQKAPDGLNFCMRVLSSSYAPRDISAWVKDFLASLEYPELFSGYASEFARGLGMDEAAIRRDLSARLDIPGSARNGAEEGAHAGGAGRSRTGDLSLLARASAVSRPDTDRQFMSFAVRCPRFWDGLQSRGLEFALKESFWLDFWDKLVYAGKGVSEAELLEILDDKQKSFWIRFRTVEALPPDPDKEQLEFEHICSRIERLIKEKQNLSRRQAMNELRGDDFEKAFLKALHEKHTGKPLVEK